MNKRECLKIALDIFINTYDPLSNYCDGYIYVRIKKGMYGLVQSGISTHYAIKEHLNPYGYATENIIQYLWTHTAKDINFTLLVDDFGIEYTHKKDADHLILSLQAKYEVTQDCTGGLYCGIKLKGDYKKRQLDIANPGYVKYALNKFQDPTPTRPH